MYEHPEQAQPWGEDPWGEDPFERPEATRQDGRQRLFNRGSLSRRNILIGGAALGTPIALGVSCFFIPRLFGALTNSADNQRGVNNNPQRDGSPIQPEQQLDLPILDHIPTDFSHSGWSISYAQENIFRSLTQIWRRPPELERNIQIQVPRVFLGLFSFFESNTNIRLNPISADINSPDIVTVGITRDFESVQQFTLRPRTPSMSRHLLLLESADNEEIYLRVQRIGNPWVYELVFFRANT